MLKILSISIIDFHLHFPVSHDVYLDGWEKRFIDRFGKAKLQKIYHNQQTLSEHWLDAYLIPRTEEDLNVYIDTTGTNDWIRWMPYPVTIRDLFRVFTETVGSQRIIFGSDSNHFPRGFTYPVFQTQWQACRDIGLDDSSMCAIFHDNAARLLKNVRA